MGRVGAAEAPTARYTPAALASGMAQFNQRLLQVCQERDVECIDLAAAINGVEAFLRRCSLQRSRFSSRRRCDFIRAERVMSRLYGSFTF